MDGIVVVCIPVVVVDADVVVVADEVVPSTGLLPVQLLRMR